MASIPWWVTSPFWWGIAHPAEAFVIGYGIRHAPVPVARGLWATARIMGPATLELGVALGIITYESSTIARTAVGVLAVTGVIGAVVATTVIATVAVRATQEAIIETLPEHERAPTRKGFSQGLTGTGPGIGSWSPPGGWTG